MKIITLNTWGGRAGNEKLLTFFKQHKDTVDIFCLQEVWSAPYDHLEGSNAGGKTIDHSNILVYGLQEISQILTEHTAYFRPHHLENYGLLMLVRKSLSVLEESECFVHKHKGFVPIGDVGLHARNVQYAKIKVGEKELAILNFHGLWNGRGKTDSADRLEQSENIIQLLQDLQIPVVFCGDFNLLPDTESLKMIEHYGLKNLIKEYDAKSTRTSFYTKEDKFADYILVSPEIKVIDFTVLTEEVSDHAALMVEVR